MATLEGGEEWATATVGECLSAPGSLPTGLPTTAYLISGAFPIIDQGAKAIAGWTDDESRVISDILPVVIFGDHTRALKYVAEPFARGADGTQVLRPKPTLDPLYFYYACRAVDLQPRGYNRHFSLLREQEIRFPTSIEVQRSIADVLAKVESAATLHQQLNVLGVELADTLREALFTGRYGETGAVDSSIGDIPPGWSARPLSELCEILSGGTPRKSVIEYWGGEMPWVSGKDLKSGRISDAIDHITTLAVEDGSRVAPAEAVLLLVRGMGLAKDLPVATISREMSFNQDVKALVSSGEYSGRFLREAIYAGKKRLLGQIVPSAHGTMTLNLDDVETMLVACPPDSDEAERIVELLGAVQNKFDIHRQKAAITRELFQSLLHQLTAGELAIEELNLSALSARMRVEEEVSA